MARNAQAVPPLFEYQLVFHSRPHAFGVIAINPPQQNFYAEVLYFENIPIKAPDCVEDLALVMARRRLAQLFQNMGPYRARILENLRRHGVELHIIGRNQALTDLPENRAMKGQPSADRPDLAWDQRARGLGGPLVSCGEENLLMLAHDRYAGYDVCKHEFAHAIRNFGMSARVRRRFDEQYARSIAHGLWVGTYAGTNPDEFFAELSERYFGKGKKGFRFYDPESFALFDDFYLGRLNPSEFSSPDAN